MPHSSNLVKSKIHLFFVGNTMASTFVAHDRENVYSHISKAYVHDTELANVFYFKSNIT